MQFVKKTIFFLLKGLKKLFTKQNCCKAILFLALIHTQKIRAQRVVRYDLYISDTTIHYNGKKVHGMAINGQIPAPTLYFTEGDTAEIYVHNELKEESSIHWHGIILPNEQDGVPYLTTAPTKKKTTHLYKFPIVQNGTYWYHSHTKLQEQQGLYGALVIYKKEKAQEVIPEYTMVLSDWTKEKPKEVHRSLHNANDWYAIKKGATQSYGEAIKEGYFKSRFAADWKRMLPMDVSDVYYNKFFVNGSTEKEEPQFRPGSKVRLRIVNGSASTYFWLRYAGGKMSVVANDGSDVVPVKVDRMMIAVAETYDVIVSIPDSLSYEFSATPEDRTQQVSLWLGSGVKKLLPPMPRLNYFEGLKMMDHMMNMDGSMDNMGMQMSNQSMDMNAVMYPEIISKNQEHNNNSMDMKSNTPGKIITLNYSMLKSPVKTTLPEGTWKTLHFKLTGNMNRYLWTLDNKTISEADKILIKKGENIRIVLENASMMRHPMHLHGHFFRVLNGQGEYAPLKNTLDIMPMETDTIEFAATASGDWFFHCHILYHMMSGMGRIFEYENSAPNPQIPNPKQALRKVYRDDRSFHPMARITMETNGSDGEVMLSNKRNKISTEWRLGFDVMNDYESETHFSRYIGRQQFFTAYIGADFRNHNIMKNSMDLKPGSLNNRQVACIGVQYVLPMFITADLRLDHTGKVRLQFMREDIPVTKRLRMDAMVNTDMEYMVGMRYILTKYISLATHYDSDMKFGAGIALTY
jgi:FtsP/CotA-like multicopper oxidase with cupredoxin domain